MLDALAAELPADGMAGDLQRAGLRLAAARDPLPDDPARPTAAGRPPRPAAVRPAGLPPPAERRPAEDGRDGAARAATAATTSTAGRSPAATSRCSGGGPVGPIAEVVRHNHEDVRSLARLLAHADTHLGAASDRRSAPAGDLVGLARAYRRTRRDRTTRSTASMRPSRHATGGGRRAGAVDHDPDPACRRAGRRTPTEHHDRERDRRASPAPAPARSPSRGARDVAGRRAGWRSLGGRRWIEVAKCLEHRRHDPAGALGACGARTGSPSALASSAGRCRSSRRTSAGGGDD